MGKKKSVVLLTLITIVIVVLCAVAVFPSFHLSVFKKDSVKTWNPVVSLYDTDEELGGGYVARYYPAGVISATEYDSNCRSISQQEGEEKLQEYVDSYEKHGGVYLSRNEDDKVMRRVTGENGDSYAVTDAFKAWFDETADLVASRYARMQYSTVCVSVADDYVLEVKLPKSSVNSTVSSALTTFAYTGELTITDGTNTYPGKLETGTDYFKSFKVKTSGSSAYLQIKTTDKGSDILKTFASGTSTITVKIGNDTVLSPSGSNFENLSGNTWAIGLKYEEAGKILAATLDSALHYAQGDSGYSFDSDKTEISSYEAVYGGNGKTMLYVAALIVLAIAVILPIILYKGYGVAMAYGTMTYFLIVAFLYAYVTNAVFEISAVSALLFAAGLALIFAVESRVYKKIKAEAALGKTVASAVKNAFKKTLSPSVDVCVVAVLGSAAFLIGGALLNTVAAQAVICFAAAAFVCLLWTRVINYLLFSAAKDKYAFYRLKREDDDDE